VVGKYAGKVQALSAKTGKIFQRHRRIPRKILPGSAKTLKNISVIGENAEKY